MSRIERGIAALLLATAVAGGALIPRLLSQPAGPVRAAVEAALVPRAGRVVVEAPAIPTPTRRTARPRFVAQPPATLTPAPLVPVNASRPAHKSSTAPVHHASSPPKSAPTPPSAQPGTPTVATDLGKPTSTETRPGNGYGDKNHVHTGPPGQATGSAQPGPDVEGSGHGRPVPQTAPHAVGTHGRGVGHLAKAPPAAAPAAHAACAQARAEARGQSGHGGSPPPGVMHGHSGGH
jgi:hypothetical protein